MYARIEWINATTTGNPKVQEGLEQKYRDTISKELSSRSGGLGIEDQKVNQAIHLLTLMEQNKDAKTGEYTIPKAQYAELANGLATLISPNGRPTDAMRAEIEQRTAKGDLAGALTYLDGTLRAASTQAIFQNLRDSIVRQGRTAEQNRAGYFDAMKNLAPTDLTPDRREKLEKAQKLNSLDSVLGASGTPAGGVHPAPGAHGPTVRLVAPDGAEQDVDPADVAHYLARGAKVKGA
jgi:hypothetical protein